MSDPQLTLVDVEPRHCTLCGAPYGRPDPTCARCDLRRNPLPAALPDPEADRRALEAEQFSALRLRRLHALGRRIRVGLVGCSASKRPGPHPARELYTGNFFRRALPIALASSDEVWILSALYGLLALDRVVETYDASLPGRHGDRAIWGRGVQTSLYNAYGALPLHLVFFCGAPYVEGVTGYDLRTDRAVSFNTAPFAHDRWTFDTPLRGLDRAARFSWFGAHGAAASPPAGPGGEAPLPEVLR